MSLFPHQIEIVRSALRHRNFAVLADMGVGKTLCAIELIKVYASEDKALKVLVIAPNTILETGSQRYPSGLALKPLSCKAQRRSALSY